MSRLITKIQRDDSLGTSGGNQKQIRRGFRMEESCDRGIVTHQEIFVSRLRRSKLG